MFCIPRVTKVRRLIRTPYSYCTELAKPNSKAKVWKCIISINVKIDATEDYNATVDYGTKEGD